ncbi:MAG: hypothetical protein Q9M27_05950 [Mariprofundaceae bacterium]|nr:hypothetical protein [Mariprofundaceae bacterium]
MHGYLVSFLLYAIPANAIAVPVLMFGRRKVRWHILEYPLIYLPWVAFIALTVTIFGGMDKLPELSAAKIFLLVFQSLGSGVMGGMILLPRLAIRNQTMYPVAITATSAFVVALLYVKFRMVLFIVVPGASSAAS